MYSSAQGIGGAGLEEQEPGPDRAVRVLEPNRDEAHFLAGHLRAGLEGEISGGAGVPRRIPGAAHALTGGPRLEHVHRAAHGHQHGLCLEDVELVLAHARSPQRRRIVSPSIRGADDEDALEDLLDARSGVLGRLRDDDLVRFAVDHQLPAAFMNVIAGFILPDRQAPFFEQVNR